MAVQLNEEHESPPAVVVAPHLVSLSHKAAAYRMDVSLPSYEAAMREAREYLRRRDLSSNDEVPLYFAWERLYAAANANLSTDFMQESGEERRARQYARLAPRRGLPPPLFTSFDKVNRSSAQASAFLRTGKSSDAAIEMMARRYRREAEKLRTTREKLAMNSMDGATKRLKRGTRQKSSEEEVEELLEAFEHSKVLPEDKLRASTTRRTKFGSKADSATAAKAAELRKSSFSRQNPAEFSNVADVAAFAAQVSDWRMRLDESTASPVSKPLRKKKSAATDAKRLSEANEVRGSARVEDGEGDMTFDTSSFEEDSAESDSSDEVESSGAFQTGKGQTQRDGVVGSKAEANQGRKAGAAPGKRPSSTATKTDTSTIPQSKKASTLGAAGKRVQDPSSTASNRETKSTIPDRRHKASTPGAAPGKKLQDPFNAAKNTDMKSNTAQQALAEDFDSSTSEFQQKLQQKLAQLSHAVGDMQFKIQGKQIEVTFKGELDDTSNDSEDGEAVASAISPTKSTVAQKVFDTAARDEDGDAEAEESAQQLTHSGMSSKASADLPQKQSSVRFAGVESGDHNEEDNEDDCASDEYASEEKAVQCNTSRSSVLNVQEDQPPRLRSSTRSSARDSTLTRSTVETELMSDEECSEDGAEMVDKRSSNKLRPQQVDYNEEREHVSQDENHDARTNKSSIQDTSNDESQDLDRSSSRSRQSDENRHTTKSASVPTRKGDTRSQPPRVRANSSESIRSQGEKPRLSTETNGEAQSAIFTEQDASDKRGSSKLRRQQADSDQEREQIDQGANRDAATNKPSILVNEAQELRPSSSRRHHSAESRDRSAHNSKSALVPTKRGDTHSQSSRDSTDSSDNARGKARLSTETNSEAQGANLSEQDARDGQRGHNSKSASAPTMRGDTRSQSSHDSADSSDNTRSLGEQARLSTEKDNEAEGDKFTEQEHDDHERRTTARGSDASRSHQRLNHCIEPSDNVNYAGMANDEEIDSSEDVPISSKRKSYRATTEDTEYRHTAHPSRTSSTMRKQSTAKAELVSDEKSSGKSKADGEMKDKRGSSKLRRQQVGDDQERVNNPSTEVDEEDALTDEGQGQLRSSSQRWHPDEKRHTTKSASVPTKRGDTRSQSSRERADSADNTRSHNKKHSRLSTDKDDMLTEQDATDGYPATRRQSRVDTTRTKGRTTRQEPRSHQRLNHHSEPSDNENYGDDEEIDSSEEVLDSSNRRRDRVYSKKTENHRTSSASRDQSALRMPKTHDKHRAPQRSCNQLEELVEGKFSSDEELSEGPDAPYRRPQQHRHHDSNRKESGRLSSKPAKSHSKRRSYLSESSSDSDTKSSSEYDSREKHRSRTRPSSQPHHSTRNHHQPSRTAMQNFIPAMQYPPKLSNPSIRLKRDSKTKSESRSKEVAGRSPKLPEGIVWPPGMEDECIARLGLDGHHPIAPPGLEHLVTETQWGDYWTWLHWYSSWQMWYMKNGKKKSNRKSDKTKRSDRHAKTFDSPDLETEHYEKRTPRNANWWVDVGPDKQRSRRRVE